MNEFRFHGCARNVLLLVIGLQVGVMGCDKSEIALREAEDAAYRDAMDNVELISKFHELFPGAIGHFTYFTRDFGETRWNSTAFIYGRYELRMTVPVQLSKNRQRVVDLGEPVFLLIEARRIGRGGDRRRMEIEPAHAPWRFGNDTWGEVVKAKGQIEQVLTKEVLQALETREAARRAEQDRKQGFGTNPDSIPSAPGGGPDGGQHDQEPRIRTDEPVAEFDKYVEQEKLARRRPPADH
ncbi:MAG: hypothetical protein WED34_01210 [Planctomycetales bacterium]